jgi:trk system potassium uptake protein TrkA
MKAIIVGGGKVGYYLVKTLKGNRVTITLIEKDPAVAARISEELDIDVVCGDGSDLEVLAECGVQDVELVAAVTGSDEENLVVCQIAKTSFHVAKTIARINNPKNIEMFKALGVDKTVCSTEVIADLIEYEVDNDAVRVVQTFEMGSMVLAEVRHGYQRHRLAFGLRRRLDRPRRESHLSARRHRHPSGRRSPGRHR